jgi:hypothetical protein
MAADRPVPVRFGSELIARADRVAAALVARAAGAKITRSEVFRLATERGLRVLEEEINQQNAVEADEVSTLLYARRGSALEPKEVSAALEAKWKRNVPFEEAKSLLVEHRKWIELRGGRIRPPADTK